LWQTKSPMNKGKAFPMRIGVVHTAGSPCGCADAIAIGLHALGHAVLIFDSEQIPRDAAEISATCDLVVDHSDTYRGSGLLRPFVRLLLENAGAKIVGSGSRACFLADDKAAAKRSLSEAGIPVPPGIVVTARDQELPDWLRPPLILKPSFEHMSRGLEVIETGERAHAAIGEVLGRFDQPVLAEEFIPGRELAVSLIEEEAGLVLLPPLEWLMAAGSSAVLTEEYKNIAIVQERSDARPAALPPDLESTLADFCILAFRTLGLRDYARFDIRLSSGGAFYFLEANTTPSLEPFEALALSAKWAGMEYAALVEKLLAAALRRYGRPPFHASRKKAVTIPAGLIELEIPEKVHAPPDSTLVLSELLDVHEGEQVLELGCGAGLLSIAAAKLGAARVVATDMDPRALESTGRNALENGVAGRIEIRAGFWYEAVRANEKFDVIIATPPQTPGHFAFGPRYGGFDGTRHLLAVSAGASAFLNENGRLWLLAISLANPSGLLRRMRQCFRDVSVVRETERPFEGREYEYIAKGLMRHFRYLRSCGLSEFEDAGEGKYIFRNLFIRASGRNSS
jgi:D-alanine-D-alanine ligase